MSFIGVKEFLFKNKKETIFITILLAVSIPLRFVNLSYSDYIGDEHKSFIEPDSGVNLTEFFLSRRKGPMQFLISELPRMVIGDYKNELAERTPYAVLNIMSVLLFYGLVKKLTKSSEVAFISSLLFTLNGLIIGFGRIAQYQSLNLFFSFASLYFYADLLYEKKNLIRSTLVGTLTFSISFLSHWDAVFIVPFILIIFGKFLFNKGFSKKFKLKILLTNTTFGCILLLPFVLPYVEVQKALPANLKYLNRRLDFGYFNGERYKFLIDLYNPFITYWFLVAVTALGTIWYKKSWQFLAWFAVNYAIFEIYVRKPGTHIYNFLLPVFVLGGIVVVNLIRAVPKLLKKVFYGIFTILMMFFFYQSYMIFVDHTREYPWENETLFSWVCPEIEDRLGRLTKCDEFIRENLETKDYKIEDKAPLFGFPLSRHWKEINAIVTADMEKIGGSRYGFTTNEAKTISQWYMERSFSVEGGFYVIGVKRPLSFINDWRFMHIGRKNLIDELYNGDRLVVKIWRVDPKDE